MFRTDDPIADFERYDAMQSELLERLPVCVECGEPVQDECYYEINGEVVCRECLDNNYKKFVDDYIY